jgi:hypothetical protein
MFGKVHLDCCYLLAPECFDPPTAPVIPIERDTMRAVFREVAATLPEAPLTRVHRLLAAPRAVLVLCSYLADKGKVDHESELRAYHDFFASASPTPPSSRFVVKPHPRMSRAQFRRLIDTLVPFGNSVDVIEEPALRAAPLEAIVLGRGERSVPHDVVSFSTAGLNLAILSDVRVIQGFGETIVDRYFAPSLRAARRRHEATIRRGLAQCEARRSPSEGRSAGTDGTNP